MAFPPTIESNVKDLFHRAKKLLFRRFVCYILAAFLLLLAACLTIFMQKRSTLPSPSEALAQAEALAGEGRIEEAFLGLEDFYRISSEPMPLNPLFLSFCASQTRSLLKKDLLEELSPEEVENIAIIWDKALHYSMRNSQRSHSEADFAGASQTVLPPRVLPVPKGQLPTWEPVFQKLECLYDFQNSSFLRQEILELIKAQRTATQAARLLPAVNELIRIQLKKTIERLEVAIALGRISEAEAQIRRLECFGSEMPQLSTLKDKLARKKK
ncbi:MAG: hypothetical protein WA705_11420 [Candidatus Ozemobacteraceae bacterium]